MNEDFCKTHPHVVPEWDGYGLVCSQCVLSSRVPSNPINGQFWISFHSIPGRVGYMTTVVSGKDEHEARLRAKWRYPLIDKQSIAGPWNTENDAIHYTRYIAGSIYDRLASLAR